MQTIVSEIAFTFVDDAAALVTGMGRVLRALAVEAFAAVRARLLAPVDRLARACDVAGVIAARDARTQFIPTPRRWRDHLNIFRGLYDLT